MNQNRRIQNVKYWLRYDSQGNPTMVVQVIMESDDIYRKAYSYETVELLAAEAGFLEEDMAFMPLWEDGLKGFNKITNTEFNLLLKEVRRKQC